MKHSVLFICGLFLLAFNGNSQPFQINWQQCYGGSSEEGGHSIVNTDDGFLLLGTTYSNNGNVSGNHGQNDYWLIKTDLDGNLQWQKCYGGSADETARRIVPCLDGGYLLCGTTYSMSSPGYYNGDVTGNHGSFDYWLVKINAQGTIEWSKCLGGLGYDILLDIAPAEDSGFLICGESDSEDGDVTGNHGLIDAWVVRIDHQGAIKWQRSFGGSDLDNGISIISTTDGGFILISNTSSTDGDVMSYMHGSSDVWIVKGDSMGNIEWEKCYGGSNSEGTGSIISTPDSGYIFVSATTSNDGDVSGLHNPGLYCDIWVVNINHNGTLIWQKCFGGAIIEYAYHIETASDGSYFIGGETQSNDGDVSGNHSYPNMLISDMWLFKISPLGELLSQQCLGGLEYDWLEDFCVLPGGRLMLLGGTETSDNSGDVNCEHHGPGTGDFWLLSVTDSTYVGQEILKSKIEQIQIYPNPGSRIITFEYNLDESAAPGNIVIFDVLGKVQQVFPLHESKGKIQWNVEGVRPGMFYCQLLNGKASFVNKIVIVDP